MPQLPLIETLAKHEPTIPRPRHQTSNVDLVLDYDSEIDAKDEFRHSIEVRKPSSSSCSTGPLGLPASAIRRTKGLLAKEPNYGQQRIFR